MQTRAWGPAAGPARRAERSGRDTIPTRPRVAAPLSPQGVLQLQRLVGNRATAAALGAPTVQRDVGFEFETASLRCRQVPGAATVPANIKQKQGGEHDQTWYDRRKNSSERLPKADRFLTSADLTLEADDKGSDSSCEAVTTHFPENNHGRQRLTNALDALIAVDGRLTAAPADSVRTSGELAGNGLAASKQNVFIEHPPYPNPAWIGAPQMTMGLGLKDIQTFVADLLARSGETGLEANQRRPGRDLVRPNLINPANPAGSAAANLVSGSALADQAITIYRVAHAAAPPASPELKGLLTLIYSIRESVAHAVLSGFLKSTSDLLAKTDYAAMFRQLPPADRHYYGGRSKWLSKTHPPLVDLVAAAPGYNALMARPLFDVANQFFDEVNLGEAEWYKDLIFEDWIYAMTSGRDKLKDKLKDKIHGRGKDLLTTKAFPNIPAGKTVEGFGVLGSRTDTGPLNTRLPVMEFRSFAKLMNPTQFKTAALKLFDYVRGLNAGFHNPIT